MLIEVPISTLISYAIDRIFRSTDDEAIREALATQRELVETFDKSIAGRDDTINRTLDLLRDQIERGNQLSDKVIQIQDRIITDHQRQQQLHNNRHELRKISNEQEAELLTMAAPLLKEMNVPLRKSSSKLNIRTKIGDKYSNIINANKEMADAVDLSVVDKFTTVIDVNIVQFNKHNGWGKFENEEWDGLASFSVPGDLLDDVKETIVNSMNLELVSVECFFVRSPAGIPQRIIITDLWRVDD